MLHSLIVSGGGGKQRYQKALQIATQIDPQLQPGSADLHRITEDKGSIGIDRIRRLQSWLSRKPYQANNKTVIISNAERLTPEAQNALLKTLEKPPAHSHLILTTANHYRLLPTIRSRCQIINLAGERATEQTTDKNLGYFLSLPLAQQINCAQRMGKKKSQLVNWLENQARYYRRQNQRGQKGTARLTSHLEKARQMIKHNVSPKLALEYIMLNDF